MKVILYCNSDGSYTVSIQKADGSRFHVRVFSPSYPGHKIYKFAYDCAYALADFMEVDFTEISD